MSDSLYNEIVRDCFCFICKDSGELEFGPCICSINATCSPLGKVLLVDVDSTLPNIALMRISSFYKKLGFIVKLSRLSVSYYPTKKKYYIVDGRGYKKIFVSVLYKGNLNFVNIINSCNVEYGGTGYSLEKELPKEVEASECDYSIYPENDISYGFITRGCIRNCYFCDVPKKEGSIHKVNDIHDIIKHEKVRFMDNNFLSFGGHKGILRDLVDLKIKCQFNQGLDIRLVDKENARLLGNLNYMGDYIFAFDKVSQKTVITEKLSILKQYVSDKPWKLKFYLYCHPNMDIINDVYYRILWCKRNQVLPYLMRDIECWSVKKCKIYIDLAAWCNQPKIFKNMTFPEFLTRRHPNDIERVETGVSLFKGVCLAVEVLEGRL